MPSQELGTGPRIPFPLQCPMAGEVLSPRYRCAVGDQMDKLGYQILQPGRDLERCYLLMELTQVMTHALLYQLRQADF